MLDLGWWGSSDDAAAIDGGGAVKDAVAFSPDTDPRPVNELWRKLQASMQESDRKITKLVTTHEERVSAYLRGVDELRARLAKAAETSRGVSTAAALQLVDDLKRIMESMQRDLASQKQVLKLAVDEQLPSLHRELSGLRAEVQELRAMRLQGPGAAAPPAATGMPVAPCSPTRPRLTARAGGRCHEFCLDLPLTATGLGLKIDADDRQTLKIEEVYGDGAVSKWNGTNPKMSLGPGDSIIEVNGYSGDVNNMLAECVNSTHKDVFLKVRRMWWPGRAEPLARGDAGSARHPPSAAHEALQASLDMMDGEMCAWLDRKLDGGRPNGSKDHRSCNKVTASGTPSLSL